MAELQKNEFSAGMNQDLSKSKIPANMYREAVNFRPTTDKGETDGALENIRGTLALTTIPNIAAIQKIIVDTTAPGSITITITHNAVVTSSATTFTISASSTAEDLYDFLLADANIGPLVGVNYNFYYNDLFVLMYPLSSVGTVITPAAGLTIDTAYVPAQTGLEIIGSTYINEDIYILTTNNKTTTPGQNLIPSSVGQIWKIDVNNVTNTAPTPTLIYNNYIDFSTYNAVAPSAILGRYETDTIQRIYWTDFYNKLRSLNVKDPQAFALDPSLLDVVPAIDFDIPIMTYIGSATGTAPVRPGCWQMAYRLKKNNGSITTFSPLSNMVFITVGNEQSMQGSAGGTAWLTYRGDSQGVSLTKTVTWTVGNVDTDFDKIEFCLVRRADKNDIGTYFIFEEQNISGSDSIEVICDGDKLLNATSLSLEEFVALSSTFTHCKTIATKDNRLIAGNIKNTLGEIDFDARAYRWNLAGTEFKIINNGTLSAALDASDYTSIDDDNDAICPTNLDPYGGGLYSTTYKYNTSGNLGGEGPNISYEFIAIATAADRDSGAFTVGAPNLLYTNADVTLGQEIDLGVNSVDSLGNDVNQVYTRQFPAEILAGIKFPPFNSVLIGYQNNETYRFGIQFYDKSKNPYFVEWIRDIKFPDVNDTCPGANHMFSDGTATGQTTYSKLFTAAENNEVFVTQLGIKFNIDIPADLTEKISGYSIVRVKREKEDTQVVSEGLLWAAYYSTGGTVVDGWYNWPVLNAGTIDDFKYFYYSPNILDGSLKQPEVGFRLIVTSSVTPVTANLQGTSASFPAPINTFASKFYSVGAATLDTTLTSVVFCGGSVTFNDGADLIHNYSDDNDNGNNNYYFKLNNSLTGGRYFGYVYNFKSTQYGGNTYSDRSFNEYILCSHFRPIKTKGTAINDSFFCYGGDSTTGIMDETFLAANYDLGSPGTSWGFYYPATSRVNRELRHGQHFNFNATGNAGASWTYRDTYDYNTCYSCENDIVKFYPKPEVANITQLFNNRFYISEIKINGEILDSWGIFKPNNYWDVEGSYGGINGAYMLQNEIYFVQDKAFGRLLVNPRTAITSTTGTEIQIGRGNVIDSHDYVSVETGSIHQFSFLKSAYSIFFLDARHNKIYQFSQGRPLTPESDIKGMHSWLIKNIIGNLEVTDKPVYNDTTIGINGLHGVYDYVNNELIYTIKRGESVLGVPVTTSYTLVFNERLNSFTAFYTHYPKNYVTNNRVIISANPSSLQSLHLHNFGNYGEFYGTYFPSTIEFLSNRNPEVSKVFNNLLLQTEVQNGTTLIDTDSGLTPVHETFNTIQVSNDHQNSGVITLTAMDNIVRFFRSWRTEVPRHSVSAAYTSTNLFSRMMDKYLKVKLSFTNNNNKRFILHNVISFFKIHSPK
jgi:hypothetical protein